MSQFSLDFFCLTVPKKLVGEPFCAVFQKISKKFMDKGGGEFQDFLSKIFCLTVPKISVGGGGVWSFSVSLVSGIEKVWIRGEGGVSRFSIENFLSHSAENFRGGRGGGVWSFSVSLVSGIEKVWIRGEGRV